LAACSASSALARLADHASAKSGVWFDRRIGFARHWHKHDFLDDHSAK